jgi:hypothetical protein
MPCGTQAGSQPSRVERAPAPGRGRPTGTARRAAWLIDVAAAPSSSSARATEQRRDRCPPRAPVGGRRRARSVARLELVAATTRRLRPAACDRDDRRGRGHHGRLRRLDLARGLRDRHGLGRRQRRAQPGSARPAPRACVRIVLERLLEPAPAAPSSSSRLLERPSGPARSGARRDRPASAPWITPARRSPRWRSPSGPAYLVPPAGASCSTAACGAARWRAPPRAPSRAPSGVGQNSGLPDARDRDAARALAVAATPWWPASRGEAPRRATSPAPRSPPR